MSSNGRSSRLSRSRSSQSNTAEQEGIQPNQRSRLHQIGSDSTRRACRPQHQLNPRPRNRPTLFSSTSSSSAPSHEIELFAAGPRGHMTADCWRGIHGYEEIPSILVSDRVKNRLRTGIKEDLGRAPPTVCEVCNAIIKFSAGAVDKLRGFGGRTDSSRVEGGDHKCDHSTGASK